MKTHPQKSAHNFPQSAGNVFGLDLLLDKILEYVILDRKPLQISNVYRTCRLVNKAWLQSTSRILLKSEKPLFRFHLRSENSLSGTPHVLKNGKLLEQFLKSLTEPLRPVDCAHPHLIKQSHNYFKENNHQILLDCLSNCGLGLLELHLTLSIEENLQALCTNTYFPKLQLLRVENITTIISKNKRRIPIKFIQSVLDASKQLVTFEVCCKYLNVQISNLSDLLLPSSITKIFLDLALNDSHLQVIVKNPLPNLKTLTLQGVQVAETGGLLSSIFQNVRQSLQKLHLQRVGERRLRMPGHFKLPLMEKLENLKMKNMFLELEEEQRRLHQLVPKLTHVFLTNQTSSMFCKWTVNSCFESVTSLMLSWDYSELGGRDFVHQHLHTIRLERLPKAFPNLQKLDVVIDNKADVDIIWRGMRCLRYLRIRAENIQEIVNSDLWDSILIGIPTERVAALVKYPGLWEELQHTSTCSIRNLTDLETLFLVTYRNPQSPLISEAAFKFAFLMMPKLTKLVLEGKFCLAPSQATEELKEQWERQGRSIEMYK